MQIDLAVSRLYCWRASVSSAVAICAGRNGKRKPGVIPIGEFKSALVYIFKADLLRSSLPGNKYRHTFL